MSAQAGIFYFDGRPIEPDLAARLDAPLAAFGPDGSGQYVAPGLVMVHRALHVTPEDCLERQPFVSERGNVMTWDGRLDNREDLLLQLWRDLRDDTTDVALAMAVYEKWGEQGFARLIGDWSAVVFDRVGNAVVLASDFMGVRPMYHCATRESLVWSTSLEGMVTLTGRKTEIDSRFVFTQIVGVSEPDLTPYRGVLSLSPAHVFVQKASCDGQKQQFWQCGPTTIEYHREADYAEHLRHVFRQAVGARLRSTRPVWCEVSGGLDSSSVACMAHAIASAGSAAASLRFVSYVNDASPESDERRFAEDVERYCGVPTCYLPYDDHERSGGHWLTPVVRSPIVTEAARLMQKNRDRVILTGRVGDGVMGNALDDVGSLTGLLATGQLKTFLTLAREWSRASQDPLVTVLYRSLEPLFPEAIRLRRVRAAFLAARAKTKHATDLQHAFSLTAQCAHMHGPTFQAAADRTLQSGTSRSAVLTSVRDYATARRLQSYWWTPAVRWSHPYVDRRLVEFVIAIPFHVLCPPGHPRRLMKRALVDILPARIRNRFSKGYAAPYLTRALHPIAEDLLRRLDRLAIVEGGYVDPALLSGRLRALLAGSSISYGNLLHIAAVEGWLEAHAAECQRPSSSVDDISLRPNVAVYERR